MSFAVIKMIRLGRLTLLLGVFLALSCGGGSPSPSPTPSPSPIPAPPTPPAPSPPPTPTPPPGSGQLPNLAGDWSGTLESSSFSTKAISAKFFQEVDCIDATWHTVSSGPRWVGAISAFAGPGSLSGDMSFEFPVSGRLCSGVGKISGEATSNTATLTWTLTSYRTDTCTSDVPNLIIVNLQR